MKIKFDHLRFIYYSHVSDVDLRKEEEEMATMYQRGVAIEGFPD